MARKTRKFRHLFLKQLLRSKYILQNGEYPPTGIKGQKSDIDSGNFVAVAFKSGLKRKTSGDIIS